MDEYKSLGIAAAAAAVNDTLVTNCLLLIIFWFLIFTIFSHSLPLISSLLLQLSGTKVQKWHKLAICF
jgi:hypothetical protein